MIYPSLADRLVAHRGYAARYPENTLLAVRKALETGARWVEVDVQLTADRIPVLFHDQDLSRLTGEPGVVGQLTVVQLMKRRCYYPERFGQAFADEAPATLAGLMALLPDFPDALCFVELKPVSIEQFGPEEVLVAVSDVLDPVRDRVVLISYDRSILRLAKDAGWRIGAVEARWPDLGDRELTALAPEYLFVDFRDLPDGKLRWHNARLAVFEVTEPGHAHGLMARGAALVETFEIGEMRRALAIFTDADLAV